MIRTPPKAKDTPAYVTSLKARRNDRDLGSRKSSGPAVIVPHQQAGHMTAADQIVRCCKKALANRGRPHMTLLGLSKIEPDAPGHLPNLLYCIINSPDCII